MRIPGVLLAVPVDLVAVERKSDGPFDAATKRTKADLHTREVAMQSPTGATIVTVTKARLRASVLVNGRPPRAGDALVVDGERATVESVAKVRGPGRSVAYLDVVTGDG